MTATTMRRGPAAGLRDDWKRARRGWRPWAAGAGGFVVSSSSSTLEAGKASGDLVIRVPADAFDRVRRELSGLGTIEAVSQSGEDVAAQLVDLDARLRTLRAEESALQAILG